MAKRGSNRSKELPEDWEAIKDWRRHLHKGRVAPRARYKKVSVSMSARSHDNLKLLSKKLGLPQGPSVEFAIQATLERWLLIEPARPVFDLAAWWCRDIIPDVPREDDPDLPLE